MNPDNYFDEEIDAHELGYSAGRRGAKEAERKALAETLTRLRRRGGFTSTDYTTGYRDALDQVANAHNIRTETETIVRYVA
jgi:hypothetical protein